MNRRLTFFIVDDDKTIAEILSRYLKAEGHTVFFSSSSTHALKELLEKKPDCAILDIMMPELDGIELLKQIRNEPALTGMKVVMVSGKTYEFDRKRAFSFGADGFITKPVDSKTFVDTIRRILDDKIKLCFWGVHGTMPVPGEHTTKYGGNTSCISLDFSKGDFFIFDAGTGIKMLSNHLMAAKKPLVGAKMFISHPHWDHINALPFFLPLYMQGNDIEICGPSHGDITMRELISGQMDGVYFPINIKEFSAKVSFRDLKEAEFEINDIRIKTMLLNHPGNCLGYRIEYKSKSICYVTDNELYPASSQFHNKSYLDKLSEFVKDSDALITDCTYNDENYPDKLGWGHSALGQVVDLADRAGVKTLYLFHHDLDDTDADIDKKLLNGQAILRGRDSATLCIAPKETQCFKV